ncbi:MAG: glycosyltransferase [Lachnospiraceae bacterium]|nr:glycosyltransferase [Lachnospiraceae bacterium]
MKILQINTIYKEKSTGRTCWEVEKMLEAKGHGSFTVHQVGDTSDPKHSYVVNSKRGYYFHKLMSRVTGLDGYYSYFATKRAIKVIRRYEPDIIHLRNLHGAYLHLPTLFKFLSLYDKPVVYNLHDTWAYTGKCPEYESADCDKWKRECKACPQWKRYPKSYFFDRSKKIFHDKKRWYAGIKDLTVVGVSDYMKMESFQSAMFQGRRIERIYNWVDLDNFHPYDEVQNRECRVRYGMNDKFLVVGVSSYWRKNTEYEEICALAKELGDEAQVCLVGGVDIQLPYANMHHIPNVDSMEELARIYSCADVFVNLSTAESFGKVAAEALACGTPAVVYNTTGIKEIAGEGCGGVVDQHDITGMKEKLLEFKGKEKKSYVPVCRKRAETLFHYKINAEQLISLYKEILEKKQ